MVRVQYDTRILVYIGPGAEMAGWVQNCLQKLKISYTSVTASDIQNGILQEFDLLIMPGGYTPAIIPALKQKGCKEIKKLLRERDGHYLGICAGAYIASSVELQISKSQMIRESGIFNCNIQIRDLTHPIFKGLTNSSISVYYHNGPHIQPHPDELPLAFYKNNTVSLLEVKTTFPALLFSWHPEKLSQTHSIFFNSINYLLSK